jgi:hypothetical protein
MKAKFPGLFWWGMAMIVLGSAPLVVVILAAALGLTDDPNPNPIGFGLLAAITFWPGVILALIGWRRRS